MKSLLAFMSPEDRAKVLRRFETMFDEAGQEGEEALARCLGSPVRQVLRIEREYREAKEKGEEFLPEMQEAAPAPAAPAEEKAPAFEEVFPAAADPTLEQTEPETSKAGELETALTAVFEAEPEVTLPPEPETLTEEAPQPEEPKEIPVPAAEEPVKEPAALALPVADGDPAPDADEEQDGEEDDEEEDESPGAGRVFGAVLATIPMAVVWIVMVAFFLALGLAILAAGLSVGAVAVYLSSYVISGAITFMPDLLMVAGGALVAFCVALLLFWLGLWIVVGGIMLTVRFARSMYRGILGRGKEKVEDE